MHYPFSNHSIQNSKISAFLLIIFILMIITSTIINNFFQTPLEEYSQLQQYHSVLQKNDLKDIHTLIIKNKLGEFTLTKRLSLWEISSPRILPLKQNVLATIINMLKNLKIKDIFQGDTINIANYSLSQPRLSIRYKTTTQPWVTLNFGLINPIDTSTYIEVAEKKTIYRIDAIDKMIDLNTIRFTELINSHIFSISKEEISSFQLFKHYKKGVQKRWLSFYKKGNIWVDGKGISLNFQKIERYLDHILAMKSKIILDHATEKTNKDLFYYLNNPYFSIEITDRQQHVNKYKISHFIKKIKGLKIEKYQNILIKSTLKKNADLIDKKKLSFLIKKQKFFKKSLQK